ncbi:MAG TPA: ATP-dependent protease subunit HslV [Chloroflexota bacterium]|nr:ATP-dependent protease subunit HslV [Chloroflexota bacterium]
MSRPEGHLRSTTVLAVRRNGIIAMAADGQVTMGDIVMKHRARKLRPVYGGRVLTGFAGTAADGLALLDRFENQLERHGGRVQRAAIELAKEWRTDRFLRRLDAQLLVADPSTVLIVTGEGEVIDPDEDVAAIGSGGPYAQSAAVALLRHGDMGAAEIARHAMEIAASLCIYTNHEIILETADDGNGTVHPDAS